MKRRFKPILSALEKKFSAMALSYGFPFLDMDGVIPYA